MKITKELKNACFSWDQEDKTFTIVDSNNNEVQLNKIYSFALMRFIIRIAQKNFLSVPVMRPKNSEEEIAEEELEDKNQTKFSFADDQS
jgi:hypothetical protein